MVGEALDRLAQLGLQYHADQDPAALYTFWGHLLGVESAAIRVQRKSNSTQLAGRRWRSVTAC
jgi:hypothetical protein